MATVVDTVVPVARGQVRRSRIRAPAGDDDWTIMILTGPMRTDVVEMSRDWIERWSEVVAP